MVRNCMDLLFKKARKGHHTITKTSHFGQLLTDSTSWDFFVSNNEETPLKEAVVNEKSVVMDALQSFSKEKIEENKGEPIRFKGGEISLKKESKTNHELTTELKINDFKNDVVNFIGEETFEARFKDKEGLFESHPLQVLFITEELHKRSFEVETKEQKELQSFLDPQAAILFEKMIKAMQLDFKDYAVSALKFKSEEDESSYLDYLIHEVTLFRPKLIITLGAKATNSLLGTVERLMNIHGQFYHVGFKTDKNEYATELMPLFHPELLTVAQEMKKSAWTDMQKAMKFLKGE